MTRALPSSSSITQQAAHWQAVHREGPLSDADRAAFMAWLVASPEHLREYLVLGHIGSALSEALADEDIDALLAGPDEAGRGNVLRLPQAVGQTGHAGTAPVRQRHVARWAMAACVALLTLTCGGWFLGSETAQFETPHGAPQQWTLADGSQLQLDADSRVTIYFSPLQRRLDVQRGRAAFVVADGWRPFEVQAAGLRVRDIGTTFSVSLQRELARVDVLEGRVQVRAEVDPRVLADIGAGESARIAYRDHRVELREEAPAAISGWWQGRIAFHDEALRDVVDQFNRRNRQQVLLEDAQAGSLRLSGNLRADGFEALAAYLQAQPALEVRSTAGGIHVRSRRQ